MTESNSNQSPEIAKICSGRVEFYQNEVGQYFGGGITKDMHQDWVDELLSAGITHLPKE